MKNALNIDFSVKAHGEKAAPTPRQLVGAVRRSNGGPPAARKWPIKKLSVCGLCVLVAWLMATTTSTGSNATAVSKPKPIKLASAMGPTFFFDDATNALGEGKQLLNTEHIRANTNSPDDTKSNDAKIITTANLLPNDNQSSKQSFEQLLLKELDTKSPDTPTAPEPAQTVAVTPLTTPLATPLATPLVTPLEKPLVSHPTIEAMRERAEAPSDAIEKIFEVKSGDTFSGILNDLGISLDQMPKLLSDKFVTEHLSSLRIGQKMTSVLNTDGSFHSLTVKVDEDKLVTIRRADNDFAVASVDLPIEKERVVTSGTIEHSLFAAAEQAKLNQSTIMELADIFEWELDFSRDIQKGDQFSIVFDRLYREGRYIGDGDILAAEFIRGNVNYSAVRFTTDDGQTKYYSPDGRSKQRTFLRHPVDVVRVTSRFDPQRMHPVLNKVRAHRGVDYGSPYGSPIYATADGVIKSSGFQNAYGNRVIIQHGNSISTLYAHMSKIAENSKKGVRVSRGDVIGYVGKTGRVTGTHLHYEFRKNGEHMDPLKVDLPEAAPIEAKYRDALRAISDEMIAQMRSVVPAETEVATRAD